MILLLDNYDSFTFNLYQYLGELGAEIEVVRNDKISLEQIENLNPERIVLSPGPGRPDQAGIMIDLIKYFAGKIPVLGICLGFQGMGQAFGGRVIHAPSLFHGKTSKINHIANGMFEGIPQRIEVGRYHSLIVERQTLPKCFEITAWTDDALIMGIRHRDFPMEGIQFHPESVLTRDGKTMLKNFLQQGK
jgi:anthranilate synthase/aminodeoxychorismate synthase-like glutamine amidotransferase